MPWEVSHRSGSMNKFDALMDNILDISCDSRYWVRVLAHMAGMLVMTAVALAIATAVVVLIALVVMLIGAKSLIAASPLLLLIGAAMLFAVDA